MGQNLGEKAGKGIGGAKADKNRKGKERAMWVIRTVNASETKVNEEASNILLLFFPTLLVCS